MEGVLASDRTGSRGYHPPSPPDRVRAHPVEGVDAEGTRDFIPSVSSDQRTPAQRALDEHALGVARRRAGFPADSAGGGGEGGEGGGEEEESGRALPFTCTLRAETNASTHHIPVFVFDGSLHFGLVGEFDDDSEAGGGGVGGEGRSSQAVLAGLPPDSRRVARGLGRGRGGGCVVVLGVVRTETPPSEEAGTEPDHPPLETRPLVVNLGILRAGATGRRRFNVTNLNPVEVNVTSSGAAGSLPFASLRLVGVGPLSRAPQALFEIGKHIEARSLHKATATAPGTEDPSSSTTAASGTTPPGLATPPSPATGQPSDRVTNPSRSSSRPTAHVPELVRETLKDGEVFQRETFPVEGSGVRKGWVPRRMGGKGRETTGDGGGSRGGVGGGGGGGGGGGHVCTLVPGATATFEVAATAPAEVADGTVRMEV
ncbi:unnamed protein product, partial [Laminaria digitata]